MNSLKCIFHISQTIHRLVVFPPASPFPHPDFPSQKKKTRRENVIQEIEN